jgi:hypothetical protein
MTKRMFHAGTFLAAALALVLLPGAVRAQPNHHDHDRDRDHHSRQWRQNYRAPVWYYNSGRVPYGWTRGWNNGWRSCADLPPGLARREGCRDYRGYNRGYWNGNRDRDGDRDGRADRYNRYRRGYWGNHDRDRDRHHRRDRDRGHDRD